MPKWPFKWPFKEPPRDPATEEALRRIEEARKRGARTLDLSDLQLSALPESIGQLSQLQVLSVSNNLLSTLPESIGQFTELQELNLSRNQLSALPESIGQLSRLQKLHLSGNQLSALPESIGQLSQLQKLYLSGNQLSALPESIGQLSRLQVLYLSGNQLSALPESIGQLSRLQGLSVSNNLLSTLPESIGQLSELWTLDLHGNPGLSLPDEVLGPTTRESFKTPREILDYYFATRGAKGWALREVKLIVVGRGGAGKTSLIKRLKGEPFDLQEEETHGINIRELELACADGPVQARVWDFGGQHVLHAMARVFPHRAQPLLAGARRARRHGRARRRLLAPAHSQLRRTGAGGRGAEQIWRARERDGPTHARREMRTDPRVDSDRMLGIRPQKEWH
jgi:internalin A